jgi:hypothetical protein
MIDTEGGQYVGEILDGKRHGRGTMLLANGHRYEGDWQLDQPHGHGTYFFRDESNFYQGMWLDGKRHGRGLLKLFGDEKRGEFRDGEFYAGMWQFAGIGGAIPLGEISDRYLGKRGGLVSWTCYWKGGQRYVGFVDEDSDPKGEGILYSSDGKVIRSGIWDAESVVEQHLDPDDYPFDLHQRGFLPWLFEDVDEFSDDLVYVATSTDLPNMVFVDTCDKNYRGNINPLNLADFSVNFFCSSIGRAPLRRRGNDELGQLFHGFETNVAESVFRCSVKDAVKILTLKYGWQGFNFYTDEFELSEFVNSTVSDLAESKQNPSPKTEILSNQYRSKFSALNIQWRNSLGSAARVADSTFKGCKKHFTPPKKSSLGSTLENYGVISGNRYKRARYEYEHRFAFALSEILLENITKLVTFPPTQIEGECWHCQGKVFFQKNRFAKAQRRGKVWGTSMNAQSLIDAHIESFELKGCHTICRQCNSSLTLEWAAEDCAIQDATWVKEGIVSLFNPLFAAYFPDVKEEFFILRTVHLFKSKL